MKLLVGESQGFLLLVIDLHNINGLVLVKETFIFAFDQGLLMYGS
jgi:hypothetical protein